MDVSELQTTYERLRAFANEHGLSWVLAELDEAVATGVLEVKELRQTTRRGRIIYEEPPTPSMDSPGRKRAEEFLGRRPMTPREQVEALLAALGRVLADLDTVADTAVMQLADLPRSRPADVDASERDLRDDVPQDTDEQNLRWIVSEIDFAPDDGSSDPEVTTEAIRHGGRRAEITRVLDGLLREVRS